MIICVYNDCISYDAQGNPVSYLGHTLAWEKGRQLKSFDGNTYTYNANGIRTSKTVNGVKHTYTLEGTKILKEEWAGNVLIPLYDNEDAVCGIIYNDTPYYFEKNLQGDVISIVDANSALVARYTYDAWGACTHIADANGIDLTGSASHIANINPFRYRGYYFDTDINLYYLQSRYYNPNIGRFLNSDLPILLLLMTEVLDNALTNLFVYCTNNPITHYDPMGFWKIPLSSLIGILQCVGLNPIGSALVALGLYKFRAYVIGKFTLLVAKLTSMFGPWVQTALTILAAVSGVFILGPIAVAFFDAIVQKKKGVEITIKKTWFGMPYGISAGVY